MSFLFTRNNHKKRLRKVTQKLLHFAEGSRRVLLIFLVFPKFVAARSLPGTRLYDGWGLVWADVTVC